MERIESREVFPEISTTRKTGKFYLSLTCDEYVNTGQNLVLINANAKWSCTLIRTGLNVKNEKVRDGIDQF